tara:strand:- start:2164 stop:4161 length:1998 start_codon:yes stop_codon:yes gene_type:complete
MSMDWLKNDEEEAREYWGRYKYVYALVGIFFCILVARLWQLQIIEGAELRAFSEKNRVKETKLPAPRGLFLDRENRVLVDNLPGFDVTLTPQYVTHLEETAEAISPIIEIPAKEIVDTVKKSRYRDGPFRPVRIKDNLTKDEVYQLKVIRWDHPGLNVNEVIVRSYPLADDGAQLFGYVGEISRSQLPRLNEKFEGKVQFEQGDIIGKSGLEEVWDLTIRGKDGVSYVEVDARGREAPSENPIYFGFKPKPYEAGNNLVLTLDKDIQEAAYAAMNRNDEIGPRIGGVVAMKSNGEILAWVNSPSYNPNLFSTGISTKLWSELLNHPFKPMRNKVIQDHYSPGSTFKPFVAVAALQEKIINPTTLIHAPAQIIYGRRPYHDHSRHGYGYIPVTEALERSSNVFFYKMGIALGIDRIASYAKYLGLGGKTGVEVPHEVSGLIPTEEWKEKAYGEPWQPGENLSNAIGQGFVLSTALQMAVGFNAIGLEGPVVKPFIVQKIIDTDNNVLKQFEPEVVRDTSKPNAEGLVIDKKNFEVVKEGLRRVVNGKHGTARWSAQLREIPSIQAAGKTGTTQVRSWSADEVYKKCNLRPLNLRHHGWFVGFAPYDKPEITVAVLSQHSCSGSRGAAPIAKDIMLAYFRKYHPELMKDAPSRHVSESPPSDDEVAE